MKRFLLWIISVALGQFSRPEGAAGHSLGSVPVLAQCFSAECQYHSNSGLYARNAPGRV